MKKLIHALLFSTPKTRSLEMELRILDRLLEEYNANK